MNGGVLREGLPRRPLEGDLQPLMANLQYLKDLLALPRRLAVEVA